MTEISSNPDLDNEDSLSNLSDSQISLLDECIENVDTSKQQLTDENVLNSEEIKKKFVNEMNALIQAKVKQIEDKNEEIKILKDDVKSADYDIVNLYRKINDLTLKVDKLNNIEEKKNDVELACEEKQLKERKGVCFLYVPNKWKFINSCWSCCENICVNTENPIGYCIKGNGFVQIKSDSIIKYANCREDGSDKLAQIKAENPFNKPKGNSESSLCYLNCPTFKLFYFEVKFQFEKEAEIAIGLSGEKLYLSLWAYAKLIYYCSQGKSKKIDLPSFSFKNEDIIGCGLVYPPPKINNKLPYVFFTQNGKQIGKAVLVKENYLTLTPYLQLKGYSVETNFGDDLKSKPFIYNISNHYVTEEFYKDEEIKEYKTNKWIKFFCFLNN